MSDARKAIRLLLTTTAILFGPAFDEGSQNFFGISVAIAQSAAPSPNTREGAHWLSAVDYYNEAQAALGRMQLHPRDTWQFDSAKKNYDHYVMRYIQFAARAGATVTANTHPSSVFNSGQAERSVASTTQNEPQLENIPKNEKNDADSQNQNGGGTTQISGEQSPSKQNELGIVGEEQRESDGAINSNKDTDQESLDSNDHSPGQQAISVKDSSSLISAINRATCGETIQLMNGSYNQSFEVAKNCNDREPLIIKAAAPLEVVLNTAVTVSGNNIRLEGLYFLGRNARLTVGGEGNRVFSACGRKNHF